MAQLLPGRAYDYAAFYFGPEHMRAFLILEYGLIVLYVTVLVLCVINMVNIFYRQGKWRTVPLLAFYVMSLYAIVLKVVFTVCIFMLIDIDWLFVLVSTGDYSKLGVGLVQVWMIFEIGVRIRQGLKQRESQSLEAI